MARQVVIEYFVGKEWVEICKTDMEDDATIDDERDAVRQLRKALSENSNISMSVVDGEKEYAIGISGLGKQTNIFKVRVE